MREISSEPGYDHVEGWGFFASRQAPKLDFPIWSQGELELQMRPAPGEPVVPAAVGSIAVRNETIRSVWTAVDWLLSHPGPKQMGLSSEDENEVWSFYREHSPWELKEGVIFVSVTQGRAVTKMMRGVDQEELTKKERSALAEMEGLFGAPNTYYRVDGRILLSDREEGALDKFIGPITFREMETRGLTVREQEEVAGFYCDSQELAPCRWVPRETAMALAKLISTYTWQEIIGRGLTEDELAKLIVFARTVVASRARWPS